MILSRHILFKVLLFFCALTFSGCVKEEISDILPEVDDEHAILVLHINPLSRSEDPDGVSEEIESLRIIMIDAETDLVECNTKIESKYLKQNSSELYYFFRITTPGKKKFFLFANEEEVSNLQGTADSEISLSSFLSKYKEGETSNTIDTELNSLFFSPDYNINDNNTIYLPYSSFYELDMQPGIRNEKVMFLVPAAVKWDIRIHNMRAEKVTVKSVSVRSISDNMFLLAQVGEDYNKTYQGNSLYWIDWLEKISEETNHHPELTDNEETNNGFGWIRDYKMPQSQHSEFKVSEEFEIDGQESKIGEEPIPGEKIIPTVYMPESRNLRSSISDEQVYYISLSLMDSENNQIEFNRVLARVKSLFRNTHVVLDINFTEGYLHVYGEIVDWSKKDAVKGYVTEEE